MQRGPLFLRLFDQFCAGLDAVMERLAVTALVGMIVATSMQIVFRVFFRALPWTEEVSRFLLVWATFLGATLAYRRGMHIAVTFVVDAVPGRLRQAVRGAALLIALVFFALLLQTTVNYIALQSRQLSAALRLPMRWVYMVMPISLAVMGLHCLNQLLQLLFGNAPAVGEG